MTFTVVIPARYASTRLPGKPLAMIAGKPMVVRVAERAARSGAANVIIATDDTRIANAVNDYGYQALMTRSDHATGTDRLGEVAAQLKLKADHIVVNVQGDEPLIAPRLIRLVAENLANHRLATIATAACRITDPKEFSNPNVVKVVLDQQDYALYFSRAPIPYPRDQALPWRKLPATPVYRHLGIYAYRCRFLKTYTHLAPSAIEHTEALEQLRALAYGYRISVARTTAPHAGVDTPQDLRRVRQWFRR